MEKWYKKGSALLSEIHETQLQSGETAFWFLGQCGFVFKFGKKILLIDPVLNDITGAGGQTRKHYPAPFAPEELAADYVVCTHGHIDHMAPPTLKGIADAFPQAQFVVPAGCVQTAVPLGIDGSRVIGAMDGQEITLEEGLVIHPFSAAHPSHVLDSQDDQMALGYCLDLNGTRVTHLGDTYLTDRLLRTLEAMEPPHIFLPPINGDDRFRANRNCIGNMEAEEAAKLAVHIRADLSIPTHYDMIFNNNVDPLRFAAELRSLNPAAKWMIPALGERVIYR